MSARFASNFVVLLLGAALLVALFAFGRPLADWVAVGAGAGAVVMALYSFACADQGVYQRVADVAIALIGTWAIVAARVMNAPGVWLIFGAGAGLAALGAIGLVMREIQLSAELQIGESTIGYAEFIRLSRVQREAREHSA
jgi:hypothetical protein